MSKRKINPNEIGNEKSRRSLIERMGTGVISASALAVGFLFSSPQTIHAEERK